ncbi:Uncharacterised protein [Enterobacter cloacae]|uniref:N-acetyltransferase domain-containing protein n=1 Tax=Enterobacter cloacae TaxID=550 RepID=A0A377LVJ8_ENTCL|nr:Uncharacterised protein [Enterobacter cloacae]
MDILEGHNKFYVNDANGNQVAEIVFVPTGEHLSIIEHTDVDPSLKGQGVGKQLVAKVVEKMRGENRKLSRCARLQSMSLITRGNMTIFGRKTHRRWPVFFYLTCSSSNPSAIATIIPLRPCSPHVPPADGSPAPLSNHTPPANRPVCR